MEDRFIVGAKKGLNLILTLTVFSGLIYLSFFYSAQVARQKSAEVASHFAASANQLSDLLHEKVKPFPLLLRSARGVVLGDQELTPDRWSRFVDSLDLDYRAFGIIGLTFTESVTEGERAAYLQSKRRIFPDFKIFPAGQRDEYMPVLFLAPEAVSAKVRGFDIGVEEHRRNAAHRAKALGSMALSQPISLLPTETQSLDYLLLLPVYEENSKKRAGGFRGWTTLGFSMSRLVDQAMITAGEGLHIELLDRRLDDGVIYRSGPKISGNSELMLNTGLTLGDRQLDLKITPAADGLFDVVAHKYDQHTLLTMLLLSLMVTIVVLLLLNSRFAAVRMANRLLDRFSESESRYRSLFELSPEAIIIHRDGRILMANEAAQKLMGVKVRAMMINRDIMDFVDDASKELVTKRMATVRESGNLPFVEETLKRQDGSTFLAEVSGAMIQFEDQPAVQVLFRDISSEQEIRYEAQISRAVFRYSSEPMMVTDANGIITLVNPAFTETTGFSQNEVQGLKASVLSSGYHDDNFYQGMWLALMTQGEWEGEITNRRKDGELYIQRTHISAIRNGRGEITQYICVMGDITEQKQELEKIRFQAMHDPLTGLPNRASFIAEARNLLEAARQGEQKVAALFIDLDGFKPVNDTYGHLVGDQLLVAIAERLSGFVSQQDVVARVGGDEFLVLLNKIGASDEVLVAAEELSAVISEPLTINGSDVSVGASVGVAVYPDHAQHELALIDQADKAMYAAKTSGKGTARMADQVLAESAE